MSNSSTDIAYNAIHDMISSGRITSGQQLVEKNIAEELGMSRTPIREAFRRLQQDGLVEIIKNKGCFIKRNTFTDMANGYEMISLLSSMACRHVAEFYQSLDPQDIAFLENTIVIMEQSLKTNNMRQWLETDISFHNKIVELANIDQLSSMYSNLSTYVNQVLWMITPIFVDHNKSLADHRELLKLMSQGQSEEAFQHSLNHHMRTVSIISKMGAFRNDLPSMLGTLN